jgi:HlyD family secretion protein
MGDSENEKNKENQSSVDAPLPGVRLISLPAWVILGSCLFLIVVAIFWGVFGSLEVRTTGMGVLLPDEAHAFSAEARGGGILDKVLVQVSQHVKKGQKVALVNQFHTTQEITLTKQYIAALVAEKEKVQADVLKQTELSNQLIKKIIENKKQSGAYYEQSKVYLERLLKAQDALLKKGYVTFSSRDKTQVNLIKQLMEYERDNTRALQNEINTTSANLNRYKDVIQIDLNILDQENKLAELRLNLTKNQYILSPVDGEVTSILTDVGKYIQVGDDVMTIVSKGSHYRVLGVFSPFEGKKIVAGMSVLVTPTYTNKFRYGSIEGDVDSVSQYTVSNTAILTNLNNPQLVNTLNPNNKAKLLVNIRVKLNSNTPTGFQWSSGLGPNYPVSYGSVCDLSVITERRSPISYVLPYIRGWLDVRG